MAEPSPDARPRGQEAERMARLAYEAFDAATMGPHTDLYPWDDMPAAMRAGWLAAGVAVLAARDKDNAERDQDMCVGLRAQLATVGDMWKQTLRESRKEAEQAEQRLQDAGALHLADESTIYQLERQVQTLTAMWTTLHSALGLPADQGVSADMVVGRLRSLEGAGRKLLAELSHVQLDAVQAGAGVANRRVLELRRDELAALLTSSADATGRL